MKRENIRKTHQYHSVYLLVVALGCGMTGNGSADELSLLQYNNNQTTRSRVENAGTKPWQYLSYYHQAVEVSEEIHCLALNIYFEARSESEQGQQAVGHVVMNRVAHTRYPDSICRVVRQGGEKKRNRCQFSWWCDGRSDQPTNRTAWLKSLQLAYEIYMGHSNDPTGGALWYHADYVNPDWSTTLRLGKKIGMHYFYLGRKQTAYALNTASTL
ncbi:MAG: cell wall hydrolase [Candidatus Thiodiazotropha sp. (ex Codakia rugifera)]|nr:cell wall hydrolase [Candidatus Thiodiazotropha sp. (ex Codakia rugifera)]